MASSTSAQVRHLRDASHSPKLSTFTKRSRSSRVSKKAKQTPASLMKQTLRYEKYCKYWSILSNVAAVVSISSAIFGNLQKRRWF